MEKRLYPDLDPFYKFSNIEYGAQLEECVPDYPKLDAAHEKSLHHDTAKLQTDSDNADRQRRVPMIPSAPPLSMDGGATNLLESLYSYIMEELQPPPYSPNDPLSDNDSWTDDLQPDYDDVTLSADEFPFPVLAEAPEINCRRAEGNDTNVSSRVENDGVVQRDEIGGKHSCVTTRDMSKNNDRGAKNNNNNSQDMVIVAKRNLEPGDENVGRRGKINTEYGAWVTWRKNVNKQLATVILLRRGGHVHLQNSDLSRRPLSRTSIDYVIRNARNCNGNISGGARSRGDVGGCGGRGGNAPGTSLNGTPYIMYGIPRVALSKTPHRRD